MQSTTISPRFTFVRALIAIALAASLATLAACGSDSTATGPRDVSGSYQLSTVDGASLPYTVPGTGDHTIVITSATATLGADHTYTITGTGTEDGGDPGQVIGDEGTYSVSGSTVTFVSTTFGGASYTAAATASSLTTTVPGTFAGSTNSSFTLVFDKAG